MCRQKAPAGGAEASGNEPETWGHISSHARPHGSSVVVLSAMANHEMFPVGIGGKIEKTG